MSSSNSSPRNAGLYSTLAASHNETALRNMHAGLRATARMIEEQLCLVDDFQAMLAPDTGDIMQIDLDRCYGYFFNTTRRPGGRNHSKTQLQDDAGKCSQTLRRLARHTLARIADVTAEAGPARSLRRPPPPTAPPTQRQRRPLHPPPTALPIRRRHAM